MSDEGTAIRDGTGKLWKHRDVAGRRNTTDTNCDCLIICCPLAWGAGYQSTSSSGVHDLLFHVEWYPGAYDPVTNHPCGESPSTFPSLADFKTTNIGSASYSGTGEIPGGGGGIPDLSVSITQPGDGWLYAVVSWAMHGGGPGSVTWKIRADSNGIGSWTFVGSTGNASTFCDLSLSSATSFRYSSNCRVAAVHAAFNWGNCTAGYLPRSIYLYATDTGWQGKSPPDYTASLIDGGDDFHYLTLTRAGGANVVFKKPIIIDSFAASFPAGGEGSPQITSDLYWPAGGTWQFVSASSSKCLDTESGGDPTPIDPVLTVNNGLNGPPKNAFSSYRVKFTDIVEKLIESCSCGYYLPLEVLNGREFCLLRISPPPVGILGLYYRYRETVDVVRKGYDFSDPEDPHDCVDDPGEALRLTMTIELTISQDFDSETGDNHNLIAVLSASIDGVGPLFLTRYHMDLDPMFWDPAFSFDINNIPVLSRKCDDHNTVITIDNAIERVPTCKASVEAGFALVVVSNEMAAAGTATIKPCCACPYFSIQYSLTCGTNAIAGTFPLLPGSAWTDGGNAVTAWRAGNVYLYIIPGSSPRKWRISFEPPSTFMCATSPIVVDQTTAAESPVGAFDTFDSGGVVLQASVLCEDTGPTTGPCPTSGDGQTPFYMSFSWVGCGPSITDPLGPFNPLGDGTFYYENEASDGSQFGTIICSEDGATWQFAIVDPYSCMTTILFTAPRIGNDIQPPPGTVFSYVGEDPAGMECCMAGSTATVQP